MELTIFLLVSLPSIFLCAPVEISTGSNQPSLTASNDTTKIMCDVCDGFVSAIRHLFDTHVSEDVIEKAAIVYCEEKGIEDHYICSKIVPEFKDEVLTIVASVALSSREICSRILGSKCGDSYDPFNQTWKISVPSGKPPIQPYPMPKKGSPINRILHITDIHWDPAYTEGLTTQCNEPLCCRPPNAKANLSKDAAGPWGDKHCDIPYRTVVNLMEQLRQHNEKDKFDWVYVTGDLPAHNDWTQTRNGQMAILENITHLFKEYLPGIPVYFAIGNHESAPVNSFPPPYITGDQSESWLYDKAADQWSGWLTPEAVKTLKYGGYYAVSLLTDLKVISLQTNFCSKDNWWLLINSTDPADMLKWMINELLESEKAGQKVHLIGHIPNNDKACMISWSKAFHDIIYRFENTITGYFYGHTHYDKYYVFHAVEDGGSDRPFGVGYLAPSVTSYGFHAAGYRYYDIDGTYNGSSRTVLDHYTYIMNIADANLSNKPKWVLEYSAKDAFNLTSLSPQSWSDLTEQFIKDDKLFQKFNRYISKSSSNTECHGHCKDDVICFLKSDLPDGKCEESIIDKKNSQFSDSLYKYNPLC